MLRRVLRSGSRQPRSAGTLPQRESGRKPSMDHGKRNISQLIYYRDRTRVRPRPRLGPQIEAVEINARRN